MGKYKHGKQTTPISLEEFKKIIEGVPGLRDKSFLAFLYWFGTRKSEAYERVKSDFKVKDGFLFIKCPAKKGGSRDLLKAPLEIPFMNLIVEQVENARKTKRNPKRRVWNLSDTTAWRIVKRVMPKHYPHFFRLNRAVAFLDDATTTIPEMQSWFGWRSVKAIDSYLGFSSRHLDRQAERLRAQK